MMAVFCGNDIVKVSRIQSAIEKNGERFLKRVYTTEEIQYCESRRMCKFQSYAVRFAAKEAVLKALSPRKMGDFSWQDVEVYQEENGKPKVRLHGYLEQVALEKQITEEMMDVSLSHEAEYAIATAVIEF